MVPKLPQLVKNVDLLVMFLLSTIMVLKLILDNQQKTSSKTLTLTLKMVSFNQHLWGNILQRASLSTQAMVKQDQQMHSKLMLYSTHFHRPNSMQAKRVDISVLDHILQTIKLSKKIASCINQHRQGKSIRILQHTTLLSTLTLFQEVNHTYNLVIFLEKFKEIWSGSYLRIGTTGNHQLGFHISELVQPKCTHSLNSVPMLYSTHKLIICTSTRSSTINSSNQS